MTLPPRLVGFFAFMVLAASAWMFFTRPAQPPSMADLRAFTFEEARTPEARRQGFSGRIGLEPLHGMKFIFDDAGIYPFWMHEMRFPIDILWLKNGRVVDMVTLSPPEKGKPVPTHKPASPADTVIEIPAGSATAQGIATGTLVLLP